MATGSKLRSRVRDRALSGSRPRMWSQSLAR
jgi:hypothetical protein